MAEDIFAGSAAAWQGAANQREEAAFLSGFDECDQTVRQTEWPEETADSLDAEPVAYLTEVFLAGFDEGGSEQAPRQTKWPQEGDAGTAPRANRAAAGEAASAQSDAAGFEEGEADTAQSDAAGFEEGEADTAQSDAAGFEEGAADTAQSDAVEFEEGAAGAEVGQKPIEGPPLKVYFMGKPMEIAAQDVPELVQKGLNHNRMEGKLKQMEAENQYVDAFGGMAAYYGLETKELIEHALQNFQHLELTRFQEQGLPQGEALELFYNRLANARANQPKPKGKKRDITAEIDELFRAKPDLIGLKKFPEEVAGAIRKGVDVKTAYLHYENRKLAAEKAELSTRLGTLLDRFRQEELAQKTGRAPGSLKGAGANSRRPDLFMQGFSEED